MTAERSTKPKEVMGDTGLQNTAVKRKDLEQVQQLSPSVLSEIVDRAVRNVKERKVFAENLRNELGNYSYQQLPEDSNEFSAVKAIYEGYTRTINVMSIPNLCKL